MQSPKAINGESAGGVESEERSRAALGGAILYAVAAGLWIYFSDSIVEALFSDTHRLSIAQTLKGWAFVVANAVALYVLLRYVFSTRRRVAAVEAEGRRWLQQA